LQKEDAFIVHLPSKIIKYKEAMTGCTTTSLQRFYTTMWSCNCFLHWKTI